MRAGYSDTDLEQLSSAADALLVAEGLPPGSLSNFSTGPSPCRIHSEKLIADLRLSESRQVRVEHCGCDHFYFPVDPPPEGVDGMAADMVAEVLWYWHRRHDAEDMVGEIREAIEVEFGKDRTLGHPTRYSNVSLTPIQTYYGRRSMSVHVDMQLMRHSLFPTEWSKDFKTIADVRRFFQSNRPAWRRMAVQREERAKVGAVGAIDTVALNLLRHVGWDPSQAVNLLLRQQYGMPIDLGDCELVLGWRMQTLEGRFDISPGVRWNFGALRLTNPFNVAALSGRRRELITDFYPSQLLPETAQVKCISRDEKSLTVDIDPPLTLFGIRGGKVIWIAPADRR